MLANADARVCIKLCFGGVHTDELTWTGWPELPLTESLSP